MEISVILPCYNAQDWLPNTTKKIADALLKAKVNKAEIIIVDDGSTDGSLAVANNLKLPVNTKVISQLNKGRFLARKAGIDLAQYEYILLIDTRVFIDIDAISYVKLQVKKAPDKVVWNGHVNVYKKGNIIARFMDTVTHIGWRRYFSNPRDCDYGLEDFDYYPKGTGCFFAKKEILLFAMKKFMKETKDLKNSSDDTLLIRIIANKYRINLSPNFSCTYFARNTLRQFVPHTFNRGKYFVDGFLIKGTRFYRPLQLILFTTSLIPVVILFIPQAVIYLLFISIILWITELVLALFFRIKMIDAIAFWLVSPIFTVVYLLGIWSVVIQLIFRSRNESRAN